VLPCPEEHDGDTSRVHHADQRADHVSHRIGLRYNEAVQLPARAETRVEIPCLRNRVCAHQRLAHHEYLVWIRELAKLLQRRHEPLVVVPSPRSIDQDDIEPVLLGVLHRVGRNVRRVLAVALLEDVHAAALALRQFLQVPHVHTQLLDGAGAERVGGGDEHAVVVLQQEEGDFGEVCGFADAVHADDGEDVGACAGGVYGGDFAEEVEGVGGREDAGECFFHRGAQGGFDGYGLSAAGVWSGEGTHW
jgi:hypothetical protein